MIVREDILKRIFHSTRVQKKFNLFFHSPFTHEFILLLHIPFFTFSTFAIATPST